jgi:CubicO group peptidase (beta-lactamase class C family)
MPLPNGLLPETERALLHRIAVAQRDGRAPSLAAAVLRGGRTVWNGSRSCAGEEHAPTPEVQFRIGSITKTFVAVQVLRLRDEGVLDLADPLGRHLPDTGDDRADQLTIASLLSHTSGLAAETPEPWWERTSGELRPTLPELLPEPALRHPSGRRFHYSNTGFALLGALVARLRGAPWEQTLRAELLEPLALRRTSLLPEAPHAGGWAVHPWADVMLPEPLTDTGLMAPAGQLWSTTADLCRWAAFLTAGDPAVLSRDTLEEMRAPLAPAAGAPSESWGLGLQLAQRGEGFLFGHGGSMPGFLAALWIDPEQELAAVVLANCTSGPAVGATCQDLLRIVAEREPRLPEPWRPLAADAVRPELLDLLGTWYWGPAPFALRLTADRGLELRPLSAQGRGSRFRERPDGGWTGLDDYYAGERLRPVRDADGNPTHLDLGSFVFTREPYSPAAVVPGGVDEDGWRGL